MLVSLVLFAPLFVLLAPGSVSSFAMKDIKPYLKLPSRHVVLRDFEFANVTAAIVDRHEPVASRVFIVQDAQLHFFLYDDNVVTRCYWTGHVKPESKIDIMVALQTWYNDNLAPAEPELTAHLSDKNDDLAWMMARMNVSGIIIGDF